MAEAVPVVDGRARPFEWWMTSNLALGLAFNCLLPVLLPSYVLSMGGSPTDVGVSMAMAGLFALLALVAALSARMASVQARGGQAGGAQAPGSLSALTRLLPYSPLVIAAFVPLAAGLYLLTTTTWTVAERLLLRSRAGLPASPGSPAAHRSPAGQGPGAAKHGTAAPRAGSAH